MGPSYDLIDVGNKRFQGDKANGVDLKRRRLSREEWTVSSSRRTALQGEDCSMRQRINDFSMLNPHPFYLDGVARHSLAGRLGQPALMLQQFS